MTILRQERQKSKIGLTEFKTKNYPTKPGEFKKNPNFTYMQLLVYCPAAALLGNTNILLTLVTKIFPTLLGFLCCCLVIFNHKMMKYL